MSDNGEVKTEAKDFVLKVTNKNGHFNVEINTNSLAEIALAIRIANMQVDMFMIKAFQANAAKEESGKIVPASTILDRMRNGR